MIDTIAISTLLDSLRAIEELIADRGPIKVLPRPASEIPNIPALQARMDAVHASLRVQRNYKAPKGHDLPGPATDAEYDLTEIGLVEDLKDIPKGLDTAHPNSTTIVRVGFPSGAHLWFDPSDLELVP